MRTLTQSIQKDNGSAFEILQKLGRKLTEAIRRAELKGNRELVERLFLRKAEVVKRLRECNAS